MLNHFEIPSSRSPRHTRGTARTTKASNKPRKGAELEAAERETNPRNRGNRKVADAHAAGDRIGGSLWCGEGVYRTDGGAEAADEREGERHHHLRLHPPRLPLARAS